MIHFSIKKFSELTTLELYQLLQLRTEVFIVEQNCPYQDCDDKDAFSIHLLGYENENLVAYARLLPKGISYDQYCSIGRVLTKASVRKKAYGKQLMNEAIIYCQSNFTDPIKISAQAYLEKFYQDLGFVTVSKPYMEDDIPHIAMIYKQLS
jgi:ElaA protein